MGTHQQLLGQDGLHHDINQELTEKDDSGTENNAGRGRTESRDVNKQASSERKKHRQKNYSLGPGDTLGLRVDGNGTTEKPRLTYRARNDAGGSGHSGNEDEEEKESQKLDDDNEEIGYDSFLRPMQMQQ